MTRILLVHQPIDGGVARQHLRDLFDGLTTRGHEAVLCGPALPSASSLERSETAGAPHVHARHAAVDRPASRTCERWRAGSPGSCPGCVRT